MSNRLFQGVISQMHDVLGCELGVIDCDALIIACSDQSKVGCTNEFISLDLSETSDYFIRDGFTYMPFGPKPKNEYFVFTEGTDEAAYKCASMLCIALQNLQQFYDEKYDRNNFVKNVVLDNILPGDIQLKSRELHFNSNVTRVVFLIRIVASNDVSAFDVIQNLFPDKSKDFVFTISDTDIVLIKEVRPNIETSDLEKLAFSIADTLLSEFYTRVNVGVGTIVDNVRNLAVSF